MGFLFSSSFPANDLHAGYEVALWATYAIALVAQRRANDAQPARRGRSRSCSDPGPARPRNHRRHARGRSVGDPRAYDYHPPLDDDNALIDGSSGRVMSWADLLPPSARSTDHQGGTAYDLPRGRCASCINRISWDHELCGVCWEAQLRGALSHGSRASSPPITDDPLMGGDPLAAAAAQPR